MKQAVIQTLGCRLNQADSALLVDRLQRDGYRLLPETTLEKPDLVIVNSCTVTAQAAAKSRRAANAWRRRCPEALIVMTGCSAQIDYDERQADPNFIVLRNPEKRNLAELVAAVLAERNLPELPALDAVTAPEHAEIFQEHAYGDFPFRSRAMIKIQEGCNNFCTYCIVPYARGRERSRDFAEVLADCRHALAAGAPELVLTGVNTCAYSDHGRDLAALLDELCATLPGEWRLRLSSTEPHPNNLALLATMAKHRDRICRFLHLSLQHGDDEILQAMHRHYTTQDYAEFAHAARKMLPGLHLGTDVIVGFPGETEAQFQKSCDFIRTMEFANIHIFTYSPRRGTPAAALPGRIPPQEAKRRATFLAEIAATSGAAFRRSQRDQVLPVIFETIDRNGVAHGWSDNYLPVEAPQDTVPLRRIVPIRYLG